MSKSSSEHKKSWLTRLRFAVAAFALAAAAVAGSSVATAPDVPDPEEQAGVSWSYSAGSSSGKWRTNLGVSWS